MSIKPKAFLLLVLISFITMVSGCTQPTETTQFRKYILSGHINIINDCTNNMSDLPDSLNIAGIFNYKDGETHELARLGKETNPVKGTNNEKKAMFMFRVETNKFGDSWEITSISRGSGEPVCKQVECGGGKSCVNTSNNNFIVPAEEGEKTPTNVSRHFTIRCECSEAETSYTN